MGKPFTLKSFELADGRSYNSFQAVRKKSSRGAKAAHVGAPEAAAVPLSGFSMSVHGVEISMAAKLDLAPIFRASTTVRQRALFCDAVASTDRYEEDVENGVLVGYRWGVGLRLAVVAAQTEASSALNFGVLAASAQLNQASVSYEVVGIGLGSAMFAEVLKSTKISAPFTPESLADLQVVLGKSLPELIAARPEALTPAPYPVPPSRWSDALGEAHSMNYAMTRISEGFTLESAIESRGGGFNEATIRYVYSRVAGLTEWNKDAKPSSEARQRANAWLNR